MLFPSKVISSWNSENFLSNSAHCVNSIDTPSLMNFSRQIDGTGSIEGDSAHIKGRVIVAANDWDKTGCSWCMPICNHSSGLWNRAQQRHWVKWSNASRHKAEWYWLRIIQVATMPLAVLCASMSYYFSMTHLNSHVEGQTGASLYETKMELSISATITRVTVTNRNGMLHFC